MLTLGGAEQIRAALGSEPAVYRSLALVDADGAPPADDSLLFASEPFPGPGARHDIDLLRDALGAGATMTIPAGALPTLVLVLDGVAEIASETGDVFSLGDGRGRFFDRSAGGDGHGERRHRGCRLHRPCGAATGGVDSDAGSGPTGHRITGFANTGSRRDAAGGDCNSSRQTASDDADDDEDGLTNAAEDEAGTDPNLADTDEDGLTDGEETAETGTSPLSADTDSDGVLDGDEVAQGTDPLDGIRCSAEELPSRRPPAAEPTPAERRRCHLVTATATVWRMPSRSSWALIRSTWTPMMTD